MADIDVTKGWQWMVDQCNAGNVGYSQGNYDQPGGRGGVIDSNGNQYYDCSSIVNFSLLEMGFETPSYAPDHNPFTTYVMPDILASLGWTQIGRSAECKPGDIGLNVSSHTEMCYSGGYLGTAIFMGAHTSQTDWASQVSISSYARTDWEQIWRYEDGGTVSPNARFSFYVCAAICGNWYVESQCNPGIWESLTVRPWDWEYVYDGTGGYGLGQWTNWGTAHGRCWNLYQYLLTNGYDTEDGNAQLEFLLYEGYWNGVTSNPELQSFLTSDSTDIDDLTESFMHYWEGNLNSSLSQRQEQAKVAYDYLVEHWQDTVIWNVGNKWLSDAQWLENCVAIYQYFNLNFSGGSNAGLGGGSTSADNSGSGSRTTTQDSGDSTTNWYDEFLSMLSMMGSQGASDQLLHILRQRK